MKKILIISNNALSNTNSNGRTLMNFFDITDREYIAQFYIKNEIPNFSVCGNYFKVTDNQSLKSFFSKKEGGCKVENNKFNIIKNKRKVNLLKFRRTPFTMLLRNYCWCSYKWKGKSFEKWINDFDPDVVFVQAGDLPFILDFASLISTERKIPMIIYNSETYYFKTKNYFRDAPYSIFYNSFYKKLKTSYKNAIANSSYNIFISQSIENEYIREFNNINSRTIMTSSDLPHIYNSDNHTENVINVNYLGNLNLGRSDSLCEIAKVINESNKNVKLNVYGKIPTERVKKQLKSCPYLNYNGEISYEEVVAVMKKSDLLIHVESFDEKYTDDLKFAFSTKIADCLKSGIPFLIYSPSKIQSSTYLKNECAAHVANSKEELVDMINAIMYDKKFREKYIENALKLGKINHNKVRNRQILLEIIDQVTNNKT